MSWLTELWHQGVEYTAAHPEVMALSAVSVAIALGLGWGVRELIKIHEMKTVAQYIPKVRNKMLMRERKKFVDQLIAQDIFRALEKRVWDQTLTRFEVNERYRKLSIKSGNAFIMPGILSLTKLLLEKKKARKLHAASATASPTTNKADSKVVPIRRVFGDKSIRRQVAG